MQTLSTVYDWVMTAALVPFLLIATVWIVALALIVPDGSIRRDGWHVAAIFADEGLVIELW